MRYGARYSIRVRHRDAVWNCIQHEYNICRSITDEGFFADNYLYVTNKKKSNIQFSFENELDDTAHKKLMPIEHYDTVYVAVHSGEEKLFLDPSSGGSRKLVKAGEEKGEGFTFRYIPIENRKTE